MEAKINIAEILKDKPVNTKLYSPFYGNCILAFPEDMTIKDKSLVNRYFYDDGRGCLNGEIMLFPSKEMQDWRKFSWKKGDLLINSCGFQCIFKEWASDDYTKFNGCYSNSRDGYEDVSNAETAKFAKLDNNIAYEYVREIERKLGGKLNLETLEIEPAQSEFNDGDIVFVKSYMIGINANSMIAIFRKEKENDKYEFSPALCETNEHDTYFREDPVVLSPSDITASRPATDSEKQQLFDALAKESKAWDSEHKEIVYLKPKVYLKPFDKVLVRDRKSDYWRANLFGYIDGDGYYRCVSANWIYCIPYKGNEHLLGTTKDVEG